MAANEIAPRMSVKLDGVIWGWAVVNGSFAPVTLQGERWVFSAGFPEELAWFLTPTIMLHARTVAMEQAARDAADKKRVEEQSTAQPTDKPLPH